MVENVPPRQVWAALQDTPRAQLCDVRTDAEWAFVGLPDLSALGKQAVLIPWQIYPTMQVNQRFVDLMKEAGFDEEQDIYFLCRSGVRSLAAAQAAIAAGFPHSYNIEDGFEGPPDGDGHRGTTAGWKADGLPWRQR